MIFPISNGRSSSRRVEVALENITSQANKKAQLSYKKALGSPAIAQLVKSAKKYGVKLCEKNTPSMGECLQLDLTRDSGDTLEDAWEEAGIGLAEDVPKHMKGWKGPPKRDSKVKREKREPKKEGAKKEPAKKEEL